MRMRNIADGARSHPLLSLLPQVGLLRGKSQILVRDH